MSPDNLVVSLPGNALLEQLGELPEHVVFVRWDLTGPAPVDAIDIVVPPYMDAADKYKWLAGPKIQLVQSQSIGFDGIDKVLPPDLVFANASSVHETSTAELTLALILASQRGIPDFVRASEEGVWKPARYPSLADHTVLLVGYGGVGRAIEERLIPFETTVVRVARTARTDEHGVIHGLDELSELLPAADIVVIGVPLSDDTRHLVDDGFLSLMRDGTLLVNIARGPVVDTAALLKHVAGGRIRAALDVTDPEPLPDGHPLFGLPNVLISPHVGGATTAMMPRMARLIREQIDRMQRGDAPVNVVYRS
jgi:phosphoglycerate dehydrogenase-like enzyme